eukprot:scaffold182405_cov29-Tisochrysis_lutea.AAC.2
MTTAWGQGCLHARRGCRKTAAKERCRSVRWRVCAEWWLAPDWSYAVVMAPCMPLPRSGTENMRKGKARRP